MVTGTGSVTRDVDDHALSTYLERHLSGSDAAVRLVDGLLSRTSVQEERDFLERFSRELETNERCCVRSSTASITTRGSSNEASASRRA